jgi:beta-fructofuranosidase
LLSPTIYQKDGKTLLLGIVPDKLPTQTNYEMGWAHNYSLPRELSIDADGQLVQKPYSGLSAMRTTTTFSQTLALQGTQSLTPVSGRQLEIRGEFTVTSGEMGFHFLKSGSQQATLCYDADRGTITLDLTALQRVSNDGGAYNGIYTATLPEKPKAGETLALHLFLDGSIADIFVNDRWAFSVRLFPTDASAVTNEVFATAPTAVKVQAWRLDASQTTGIMETKIVNSGNPAAVPLCDLQGRRVGSNHRGLCVAKGRKFVHR